MPSNNLWKTLPRVTLDPLALFQFLPGTHFSMKASYVCSLSPPPPCGPLCRTPPRARPTIGLLPVTSAAPGTAPGTGQGTNPLVEGERTPPLPHGLLRPHQLSSPCGRALLQAVVQSPCRKTPPTAKTHPQKIPLRAGCRGKSKAEDQRRKQNQRQSWVKEIWLKKGGGDLRCRFWKAQGGPVVAPAQLWLCHRLITGP